MLTCFAIDESSSGQELFVYVAEAELWERTDGRLAWTRTVRIGGGAASAVRTLVQRAALPKGMTAPGSPSSLATYDAGPSLLIWEGTADGEPSIRFTYGEADLIQLRKELEAAVSCKKSPAGSD
jgi:hypothetical protein